MLSKNQRQFIRYELGLLTIKAALSTRNSAHPIYKSAVKSHQRKPVKTAIRSVLFDLERDYRMVKNEKDHFKYIEDTANDLTSKVGKYLYNSRFRVGISQKLINLHLKYLWCSNIIPEPHHCPIDGIIRDKIAADSREFSYDWISSDSIDDYRHATCTLSKVAKQNKETIAQWELREFKRRDQI